ncbi:hypothetical protein [Nonomuraea sp. NPDC005650]|uniref:hypothetical protein n=1 Tax=Nonomuraea sp. NPDC005650 TaxID=3157045 RepID=UPI0033B5D8E4
MRQMITAVAACGVLLVAGAPVQATAKDPVRALKAILASGQGVQFTETATILDGTDERAERRRTGVFEIGEKGGVKALDVTTTGGEHGRERIIGFNHDIGGTAYRSGGLVGTLLPKGKVWWEDRHQLHLWHRELLGDDEQAVNPTEPATLAALVKNGQLSGNVLTGTITFKELEKVSTWMSHSARGGFEAGTKLSYTLTLTSAGLVSRVQSTYTAADSPHGPARGALGELAGRTLHVDTRYSRWGSKVSIKAPDPRETTTELCAEKICKLRLPG